MAAAVGAREAAGLVQALADGVIHEGVLLHHGERGFPLAEGVRAVPVESVLRGGPWEPAPSESKGGKASEPASRRRNRMGRSPGSES